MDRGVGHCSRLQGGPCTSTCRSAIAEDLLQEEQVAQRKDEVQRGGLLPLQRDFAS